MSRSKTFSSILLYVACLVLLASLSGYFLLGMQMRYSGDDYCYASVVARHGFWDAQSYSYLNEATYNGNRFSLTFFSSLADLFGPRANAVIPGLAIVLGIFGFSFLVNEGLQFFHRPIRWSESILAGTCLMSFLLWTMPDRTQSLYWRSGMLPYLAPVIFSAYLFAFILRFTRQNQSGWLHLTIIFLLALVSGGFSETGLAYQAGLLGILVAGARYLTRKNRFLIQPAIKLLISALLGTTCAFFLLAFSPTNSIRLANLTSRPGLLDILRSSLAYSIQFLYISARSFSIVYIILFLFMVMLSFIVGRQIPSGRRINIISLIIYCLLIAVGGILLILACIIPSVYAQASYPTPRAMVPPRWIILVCVFLAGWLVGSVMKQISLASEQKRQAAAHIAAILLLGLSLYPLKWLPIILSDLPKYEKWSTLWDARDLQIRQAASKNQDGIEVMQLDHLITDVSELATDSANWYTGCAEQYYGIPTIQADLPGWDSP